MAVKVSFIYPSAEKYLNGQDTVTVNGGTVSECITDLVRQYPDLKNLLYDKNGQIHSYFSIFANGEYNPPVELDRPVKDGDELTITVIMSGG